MFGLMKYNRQSDCNENSNTYRLSYCGTCKAIGALYGQKSRLFLNRDVVFLNEILAELSIEEKKENWDESFSSINCLVLPEKNNIPISLKYSAAINILLSNLKIKDNVLDEKILKANLWKGTNLIYNNEFKQAKSDLSQLGLDVKTIENYAEKQIQIEGLKNSQLEFYSEQTAKITGKVFEHGFKIINMSNKKEKIGYMIGYYFGMLIYLLDAIEDFERDINLNRFNPIRVTYSIKEPNISFKTFKKLKIKIDEISYLLEENLDQLPIRKEKVDEFKERLKFNISNSIKNIKIEESSNRNNYLLISIVNSIRYTYQKLVPKIAFTFSLFLFLILPKKVFGQINSNNELIIQKGDCGDIVGCFIVLSCIGACCGDHGTVIENKGNKTIIRDGNCCD